ncbi:hypothetical protein Sjap_002589 [Stephania japonica]|uniref:UBX domain-containing protein n=1 Tax=Stephania japonica TaxID=461633 RepID=A0AAP0PUN7_9MAGN
MWPSSSSSTQRQAPPLPPPPPSSTRQSSSCSEMVRHMISLPRSIIGGVSKAMASRIGSFRGGSTSSNRLQDHSNSSHHHGPMLPVNNFTNNNVPEEWAFLDSFERSYGIHHPFFYACRFMEALKIAEQDHKLLFIYLHSPDHPFTGPFCTSTLCLDLVVQFLDANFVSWGGLASREEGLQMATALQVDTFPFCAVVAPALVDNIVILKKVHGPVSPCELVEILQRIIEEQGDAFRVSEYNKSLEERKKIEEDRRIREEQDAAYIASLQIDKVRMRMVVPSNGHDNVLRELVVEEPVKRTSSRHEAQDNHGKEKANANQITNTRQLHTHKVKEGKKDAPRKETTAHGRDLQATKILVRLPNGERREQSFQATDTIHSIYKYIDSLRLPGIGSYKLISGFPRRVYGHEQMRVTLKDAGLHPRASVFIELVR